MDPAFEVDDDRRPRASGVDATTSPVSIAWHALHDWEDARGEHRRALREAWESARPAWIALADQAHAVRSLAERFAREAEGTEVSDIVNSLRLCARNMEQTLEDAEVVVLNPEGQPFSQDTADYFEPISHTVCEDAYEPLVLEVVRPAVLMHGVLIRQGKAIIGVPRESNGETDAQSDPGGLAQ